MAVSNLVSTTVTPLTFSHKQPLHKTPSLSFNLKHLPLLASLAQPTRKLGNRFTSRRCITTQSKGSDSADVPDRLISAICYFYPFFDGIQYGKYVITQFTPIQLLIQPLVPAIKVFKSFPLNGFLVFLALYFVVVRNPNFSRTFNPRDGLGLDLVMSVDSTVFWFLLACLIYGSSSCALGKLPRLPIVAEAADRQVL